MAWPTCMHVSLPVNVVRVKGNCVIGCYASVHSMLSVFAMTWIVVQVWQMTAAGVQTWIPGNHDATDEQSLVHVSSVCGDCLLYTSDAADE